MALGVVALAVAVKVLGTYLPAVLVTDHRAATLLGVSMVPRAEITLIVVERGHALGPWAVDSELFAGFVAVCAVASTLAPVVAATLLRRWRGSTETLEPD